MIFPLKRRQYSFSSQLASLIETGKLKAESAQQEAAKVLSKLSSSLMEDSSYWLFKRPTPKGVYIHGSVGNSIILF